ncbi:MAG: hypothetical protein RL647_1613 [Bacteroidota bacterium]|jgi:hypothetical protein
MLGASLPPLVRNKRKGHPLGGLSFYLNIAFYWIEKTLYQQIFRNKYLKSKS